MTNLLSRLSRHLWLLLLVLVVLSFSVHLLPSSISQFPFNNDSLLEVRSARNIIESGHLSLFGNDDVGTTHSESTPAWNVLLAFSASLMGVDPMFVTQPVVAAISPAITLSVFLLAFSLTRDTKSALLGALFVTLFGTFLYLSSSGWKLPLGVALYVLAVYAYTMRDNPRMRVLLVVLLVVIPLVHHLVALISYMTLAYLVGWSWFHVLAFGRPTRRHYLDLAIIAVFAVMAMGYYYVVSFDRLSYIGSWRGMLLLLATMGLMLLLATVVLMKQSHSKLSFAPIPAVSLFLLAVLDYKGYLFDYEPAQGAAFFLLITGAMSFMIMFAWYGLESTIESRSSHRAIPLGMLLPPVTLFLFGMISPTVEDPHQLIYRTFDLADPALALCIAAGFVPVFRMWKHKKLGPAVAAAFLAVLLATTPFGIYTEEFTGVRHDTQGYELDAFDWVMSSHYNNTPFVNSDERISYIASVLYGLGKTNILPRFLLTNYSLTPSVYNFYEQSWATGGVNDFPHGLVVPSQEFMSRLLVVANVMYIGGPVGDEILIIQHSWIGQIQNNWYYGD